MSLLSTPRFFKRIAGILGILLVVYVVSLACLVLFQRNLMYFPDTVHFTPASIQLDGFTELAYSTPDGKKIHGFFAPPRAPHRLTIVFFQGNGGNLGMRSDKIKLWREQGYGVVLATYRGYEGNTGKPTETGLYEDARTTLDVAKSRGVKFADMVLYGESLGTGIAVEMAAKMGSVNPPAGVVLEVPYTTIPDVVTHHYPLVTPASWLLMDRYESVNKIKYVKAPVLILQAGKDMVVPPILAKQLFDAAEPPKTILTNINAGHLGIYTSTDIVKGLFSFISNLEKSPPPVAAIPALPQPVTTQPAPPENTAPVHGKKHRR